MKKKKFPEVLPGRGFFYQGFAWIKFPTTKLADGNEYNALCLGSGAFCFVPNHTEVEDYMVRLGGGKVDFNELI